MTPACCWNYHTQELVLGGWSLGLVACLVGWLTSCELGVLLDDCWFDYVFTIPLRVSLFACLPAWPKLDFQETSLLTTTCHDELVCQPVSTISQLYHICFLATLTTTKIRKAVSSRARQPSPPGQQRKSTQVSRSLWSQTAGREVKAPLGFITHSAFSYQHQAEGIVAKKWATVDTLDDSNTDKSKQKWATATKYLSSDLFVVKYSCGIWETTNQHHPCWTFSLQNQAVQVFYRGWRYFV